MNSRRYWLFTALFILWIFFVLGSFFAAQKPFSASNAQAAIRTFLDLAVAGWLALLALAIGTRLLRTLLQTELSPPEALIFGTALGLGTLGLLSLIGMMIKNAVVLVDEMDLQMKSGKAGIDAILDSGVSRLRPVGMAAFTTVLGMIPLLPDAFFNSLAVTVMGGLGFATVLTLVFVPVLYAIFFGVHEEE